MTVDYQKANSTIVDDSKELLLTQFQDAPNILKLIEIIAEEVGDYEQAAEQLFTGFLIGDAEGTTLDVIGEFLNIPREGRDDTTYRNTLLMTALGARSNISRDSLYELLMMIDGNISYELLMMIDGNISVELYTGTYHDLYIYMQDACSNLTSVIELIEKYLPVGTQTSIIRVTGSPFGFEGDPTSEGFGSAVEGNNLGGSLGSRISLTTDTILGYANSITEEKRLTEYELDSKFSETLGFASGLPQAPLQVVTPYRKFRPPLYDNATALRGFAFQSPEGVASYTTLLSFLSEVQSGIYDYTAPVPYGHLVPPNKPYYFEFEVERFPRGSINSLWGDIRFGAATKETINNSEGLYLSYFYVRVQALGNDNLYVDFVSENVDGSSNAVYKYTAQIDIVASPVAASDFDNMCVGIIIDPVNRNVRMFINGVPFDGDAGFVLVEQVSGTDEFPTPQNNPSDVSDLMTWKPSLDNMILGHIYGETKGDIYPEPASLQDYGDMQLNYNASQFKYADNLPSGIVDMFGKPVIEI